MNAPFHPRSTVEDAAIELLQAVTRLRQLRAESDHVAAALEARWAANRAARTCASELLPEQASGADPQGEWLPE